MEINFIKVHTTKDLILSSLILAAGVGLYFVQAGLGFLIGICGLLMLLFYKSGCKRTGEDVVLQKKALDVAQSCRESLKGFLDGKDVEPQVDTRALGGIIRLEVKYNAQASVAYAQLFDFSNYTYEPATDIVELRGPRADTLIAKL